MAEAEDALKIFFPKYVVPAKPAVQAQATATTAPAIRKSSKKASPEMAPIAFHRMT